MTYQYVQKLEAKQTISLNEDEYSISDAGNIDFYWARWMSFSDNLYYDANPTTRVAIDMYNRILKDNTNTDVIDWQNKKVSQDMTFQNWTNKYVKVKTNAISSVIDFETILDIIRAWWTSYLKISNWLVRVNVLNANIDFVVWWDTDANLLYCDASTDRVWIGTNTPTSKLQVVWLPSYADNASAITWWLTVWAFYHTAWVLKVVV